VNGLDRGLNRADEAPIGVKLWCDVEERPDRPTPFRARVRWADPATGNRRSLSEHFEDKDDAVGWLDGMKRAAAGGVDPASATMRLSEYGSLNMALALRGLEAKTTDPYLAGWRKRVVPTLGHLPVTMITMAPSIAQSWRGSPTTAVGRRSRTALPAS
jgi:hypothetical protein